MNMRMHPTVSRPVVIAFLSLARGETRFTKAVADGWARRVLARVLRGCRWQWFLLRALAEGICFERPNRSDNCCTNRAHRNDRLGRRGVQWCSWYYTKKYWC